MPAAACCLRPATRTWKNSSRLLAKIARNFACSSSGMSPSSASVSTRALKSIVESSRFRYLSFTAGLRGAGPASTFLTAFKASSLQFHCGPGRRALGRARGPRRLPRLAYQRLGSADGRRACMIAVPHCQQ